MTKFRQFLTSTNKLVLGGKSAENNELLVQQIEPENYVLHTAMPGSPFCEIKSEKVNKSELKEVAIFCAKYSHDWRDNKQDVLVHVFRGKDIYKEKRMKLGTFGVRKFTEIKVKKKDIEEFERNLREIGK